MNRTLATEEQERKDQELLSVRSIKKALIHQQRRRPKTKRITYQEPSPREILKERKRREKILTYARGRKVRKKLWA